MASELRVNTLKDASGNNSIATTYVAEGSAKAWLTCVGDNTAIEDSLNISSLTDVTAATGRQNYSTSFNNLHYSFVGQAESTFSTTMVNMYYNTGTLTTSAFRTGVYNASNSAVDVEHNFIHIAGDLA